MAREILLLLGAFAICHAQAQSFEVASVKPSHSIVGHDGAIKIQPGAFTARNATLKRLIFEAYEVPYSQIAGGPPWLDSSEYDIEAKAANPANAKQIKLMLQALLSERFKLALHSESQDRRVYALVVAKDGPRLHGAPKEGPGAWQFHGDISQFAGELANELNTPLLDDPTIPSHTASGTIPVVDKTGIDGVYDIGLEIKPDPGADPFAIWQRALQDQLGLKLEARKERIKILIVDHVEKVPTDN